jgi:uncharacterized membrane protein YoaK (UPF0700 family)
MASAARRLVLRGPATLRARDALLVALTFSTGAVDAVSWFALGKVFSAFMTGNLVFLGLDAAGAPGPSVTRVLASVAPFALGATLGARTLAGGPTEPEGRLWPRGVTLVLATVLVIQAVFAGLWVAVGSTPSAGTGDALIAVSALAMGMQTIAVFSLGVRGVLTTAATATLATVMGDLTAWSSTRQERRRLTGVLCGLLAGATIGGYLVQHARSFAPLLPLATTGLVVAVGARRSGR